MYLGMFIIINNALHMWDSCEAKRRETRHTADFKTSLTSSLINRLRLIFIANHVRSCGKPKSN